jgi:hypothetical protein
MPFFKKRQQSEDIAQVQYYIEGVRARIESVRNRTGVDKASVSEIFSRGEEDQWPNGYDPSTQSVKRTG